MRIIKLTTEIRYPTTPEVFKFRERIISSVNEKSPKIPTIGDGLQFAVEKKSMKVVVENSRMGADIILAKDVPNPSNFATDNMLKLFKQINSVLNVQKIKRVGVRSIWIYETSLSMSKLVEQLKTKLYNPNFPILKQVKDVNTTFAMSNNDRDITFYTGPVEVRQIPELVDLSLNIFPNIDLDLPSVSVFMDFDYFSNKEQQYSDNFISNFIDEALDQAKEKTKNMIKGLDLYE